MWIITFEVYHITPTSLRNTLTTIFKSILIFFAFIFFEYFLFEHIMHGAYKRKNKHLGKLKHHNFAMPKYTDVIRD